MNAKSTKSRRMPSPSKQFKNDLMHFGFIVQHRDSIFTLLQPIDAVQSSLQQVLNASLHIGGLIFRLDDSLANAEERASNCDGSTFVHFIDASFEIPVCHRVPS